ncbi:hypothetical protein BBJ28_00004448 [Nothophytophthora sp. Chile5]|nr:hypothetical protein BBJ28_00004448 [Nothophytophthora sp. Chile5]
MCRQENRRSPSPALEPQSTNFQRERTKEALVLRQQVAELNAHLLQLRCTRRESDTLYAGSGTVNSSRQWRGIVSVWEDLAVVQNQERQRAEITNKELKMILARQRKVCRSFRKLIREKNLFDVRAASTAFLLLLLLSLSLMIAELSAFVLRLQGMGLLCRLQPLPEQHKPRSDRFVPTFDISDPVLAELEAAVATLYLQSDLVIPPLEGQPAASCLTQDKRDEPLGTYTETSTVTPMTCPVLQAGEILWKCTTKKSRDPEKVPRFVSPLLASVGSQRVK